MEEVEHVLAFLERCCVGIPLWEFSSDPLMRYALQIGEKEGGPIFI